MPVETNIILIGYRGVGKSTIAGLIAGQLNFKKISLDDEIKNKVGPLQKFIRENGWPAFRQVETQTLKALNVEAGVIDCGGGIVERDENIDYLKSMGQIFWLKASAASLKERLLTTSRRLSLSGSNSQSYLEEITNVLTRRTPLYEKAADFTIDTEHKKAQQIAAEIIRLMLPGPAEREQK